MRFFALLLGGFLGFEFVRHIVLSGFEVLLWEVAWSEGVLKNIGALFGMWLFWKLVIGTVVGGVFCYKVVDLLARLVEQRESSQNDGDKNDGDKDDG